MKFEEMPRAPGGHGFLGHNADFRDDRLGTLQRFTGLPAPVLRLEVPFPGVHVCIVNHPDTLQEVLVEHAKSFGKADMLRFSLMPLAGEGLFTANGDLWKRQRKTMAPIFTPKALEGYADDMRACSVRAAEALFDGQETRLLTHTTRLTMAVAGKTLFDAESLAESDEIGEALTVALDWTAWTAGRTYALAHLLPKRLFERMSKEGPTFARATFARASRRCAGPVVYVGERNRKLKRAIDLLDRRVQRMIDDRRAEGATGKPRNDLLARLLEARDDQGAHMSDVQLRDEILTLFVAGHETTATGLAWTIYLALKNPEIYAALEREVDALGDDPTIGDLGRLDLCGRVFKEALRIYPPVYVASRDSKEPVTIGGYDLPAPTNTIISPYLIHRSPHVWPDPLRFDPDRFRPEEEAKRHRYAWVPFGAGPRVCIGNHFAMMEAQIALAVLLRRARFELLEDETPEGTATLRPRGGVRVRVRRRVRGDAVRLAVG